MSSSDYDITTVTDDGTNADCSTAYADLASCDAATTSGGSDVAANACVFVDNSIHDCTFVGDNLVITSATTLLVVPDVNDNMPLTPFVPAFIVFKMTAPLVSVVPSPVAF